MSSSDLSDIHAGISNMNIEHLLLRTTKLKLSKYIWSEKLKHIRFIMFTERKLHITRTYCNLNTEESRRRNRFSCLFKYNYNTAIKYFANIDTSSVILDEFSQWNRGKLMEDSELSSSSIGNRMFSCDWCVWVVACCCCCVPGPLGVDKPMSCTYLVERCLRLRLTKGMTGSGVEGDDTMLF
jgi:hypothetical protein